MATVGLTGINPLKAMQQKHGLGEGLVYNATTETSHNALLPPMVVSKANAEHVEIVKQGNAGFDAFLKDGVWKWIQPEEMIDTNWSDNGKGGDRYPDSLLDFSFVAGAVKDWKAKCRVIARHGDSPDDDKTSDHRPIELLLSE